MSPAFLWNYVNRMWQFINVKVDRCLSLVLFPEKNYEYVKKWSKQFNVCMHHGPVLNIWNHIGMMSLISQIIYMCE